jgi:hypothetical protein
MFRDSTFLLACKNRARAYCLKGRDLPGAAGQN